MNRAMERATRATYTCNEHGKVMHPLAEGEAQRIIDTGLCDPCRDDAKEKMFWGKVLIVVAAAAATALVCLGGCTEVDKKEFLVMPEPLPESHRVTKYTRADVFYLNDGTRCVALLGDAVGLACEWLDKEHPQPEHEPTTFYPNESVSLKRPQ